MVEGDGADPHLHLAVAGRRRLRHLDQGQFALGQQPQRLHRHHPRPYRWIAIAADRPPSTGSTAPVT